MRKIKDIEITEEIKKMLDGENNPLRQYLITLGQTYASKGVLFVLYAYNIGCTSPYAKSLTYLGNLGADINTAVINARKRIPKFQLIIDEYETVQNRRHNDTMPFGKYKGKTIEEIFDIDEKYIFWLSNSDSLRYIKSKKLFESLAQYSEIAKENIIAENEAKTNPALPIDEQRVERNLKLYRRDSLGKGEYGLPVNVFKFIDDLGNKYYYKGSATKLHKLSVNDTILLSCKVIDNFTSIGIVFNKISLR